jgi:hypothetical protein
VVLTKGSTIVVDQFTVRTIVIDALQLLDPARHIRLEIAMQARVGNPTQPQALAISHPLTPQVEGVHAHLHPRVGRLKPPISPCRHVPFGKDILSIVEHLGVA